MREILFRGKRIDNGEWAYSQTVFSHLDNFYIPTQNLKCTVMRNLDTVGNISEIRCKDGKCFFKVHPETVGQFTGLTDKNGKKIFEGDIVQEDDVIHNGKIQIKGKVGSISLEKSCFVVLYNDTWDFLQTNAKVVLVVGNIHDNPELLEVTE